MYKASKIWQRREMKYKKFFLRDADDSYCSAWAEAY
jgi:hypothetical protein